MECIVQYSVVCLIFRKQHILKNNNLNIEQLLTYPAMLQLSGWTLTLTAVTLLLIAILYTKVVRPYQQFRFYRRILTASYKTLVHPFDVIGLGTFRRSSKDLLKHGDSEYTLKVQYPSYQISLASFKGSVYVDFIDPHLIKEFYERQMEGCYVKSMTSPFISSLKHILGEGLVFSEGETWRMKRKIMSQVFNYDFIKSKIGLIAEICQSILNQFEKTQANKDKQEVKIDVSNLFQRIFGNVVVRSFFGDIQLNKIEGVQIFSYVNRLFELNAKRSLDLFAFFVGNNFYKYNLRQIDREARDRNVKFEQFARDAIFNHIQKIKRQGQSKQGKFNGVIELLVKQNKLKEAVPQGDQQHERNYYTINELIQEFTTFFFAGTDTTTNSTSMMVYLLAQNPKVEAKVRQEIDQVFPSPFQLKDITYENLKKLTYFDDVMKETLRMYSPVAGLGARVAVKDHYIGSIPIKKGTMIGVKIRPNQFKEEFYPNPLQFNPERWSTNDPTKAEQFSYFPFSSGKRNCIGQHLALLESKIAVLSLLKRYSKITLEKENFKKCMRALYGAEQMTTTFEKCQANI